MRQLVGIGVCVVAAAAAQPGSAAGRDPADTERIAELVLANHILAEQQVLDGFGHISVRSATNPNHYFMSRSLAPALVSADDIVEYDLDSQPLDAQGRSSYLERFIHGEIYRARPDVQAVIHSHAAAVIPFSVSSVALRPISHMAGFLIGAVPVFEIRSVGGDDSDMLIRSPLLGAALARKLGRGTVVLLRGHGDVVVGSSIKTAVLHAIYTDLDAQLETAALQLGGTITYLNPAEAANIGRINDQQVDRPWQIWAREALAAGAR